MVFSDRIVSMLALIALGLAVIAVLLAFTAAARSRKSREPDVPIRLDPALQGVLDSHKGHLQRIERAIASLGATDRRQAEDIATTVRRVALLRYDAFEDVGGRLSFSCALLDDHGSGVVLTSINGRHETRVYAKAVTRGRSDHNLSEEEGEAIRRAMLDADEAVKAG